MCKTCLFHIYVGFLNTVKLCNHCCDDHAAQYIFFLTPVSKPWKSWRYVGYLCFLPSAFFFYKGFFFGIHLELLKRRLQLIEATSSWSEAMSLLAHLWIDIRWGVPSVCHQCEHNFPLSQQITTLFFIIGLKLHILINKLL